MEINSWLAICRETRQPCLNRFWLAASIELDMIAPHYEHIARRSPPRAALHRDTIHQSIVLLIASHWSSPIFSPKTYTWNCNNIRTRDTRKSGQNKPLMLKAHQRCSLPDAQSILHHAWHSTHESYQGRQQLPESHCSSLWPMSKQKDTMWRYTTLLLSMCECGIWM